MKNRSFHQPNYRKENDKVQYHRHYYHHKNIVPNINQQYCLKYSAHLLGNTLFYLLPYLEIKIPRKRSALILAIKDHKKSRSFHLYHLFHHFHHHHNRIHQDLKLLFHPFHIYYHQTFHLKAPFRHLFLDFYNPKVKNLLKALACLLYIKRKLHLLLRHRFLYKNHPIILHIQYFLHRQSRHRHRQRLQNL